MTLQFEGEKVSYDDPHPIGRFVFRLEEPAFY